MARDNFSGLVLFGTEDCDDCARIKARWQNEADAFRGRQMVVVDLDREANYMLFLKLEEELALENTGDLPAVYANGRMYYGANAISNHWQSFREGPADAPLPDCLKNLADQADKAKSGLLFFYSEGVARNDESPPSPTSEPTLRYMAVLSLEGCSTCSRQQLVLNNLQRSMPGLAIEHYDLNTPAGQGVLSLMKTTFKVDTATPLDPPILLWPDSWAAGKLFGEKDLQARFAHDEGASPAPLPFWRQLSEAELILLGKKQSRELFSGFTFALVVAGGLIDGVNPCAFAVIVFLVSYLGCTGRKGKTVILVGGSFCLGVFLAYFLVGLGFSAFLAQVKALSWVKTLLYHALALAACLCAGIHLRDILIYRRTGQTNAMIGGLSATTTRRIHVWIKKMVILPLMIPAGIVLGAIVSLLELACTGQIYLPILSIINREGGYAKAVMLLTVYCAAFILPLALVTLLAANGIQTRIIGSWARKNLVGTKMVMAAFFIILAIVMFKLA